MPLNEYETFEIWAMFTSEGPHIVMSRTDAQNGLDFHFKDQQILHHYKMKWSVYLVYCLLKQNLF
jgi:hypothetical protein